MFQKDMNSHPWFQKALESHLPNHKDFDNSVRNFCSLSALICQYVGNDVEKSDAIYTENL